MNRHLLRALLAAVLLAGLFVPTLAFAQDDGSIAIGDVVLIDTDGVNIRDDFGTDGDIITTLEVGTSLEILDGPESADGFTWWLAVILDEDSVDEGVSGWLVEDYLTVDDGDLPPPDDDPGDDDDSTATPRPTSTATPEPSETPDVDDDVVDFENAAAIEVLDGPVNVRLEPGTNSDIIGTLDTGETAVILSGSDVETSSNYHWVNIEFGDDEGWIATAFLRPLDEAPDDGDDPGSDDPLLDADAVEVVDGPLNVRGSASTNGVIVDTLPTGTILNVWSPASIGSGNGYDWLSVDYLGDEVFVATDFIDESDVSCDVSPCVAGETDDDDPFANADDVVVIDGPLNLRADPGLDGDVLEVLDTGVSLPTVRGEALVDADGYTWVQVSRLSGTPREGWLATDFLAVGEGDSGGSGNLSAFNGALGAFVIDGPLNLRENPDTSADILMTLAVGDYVWIDALSDDGDAWVADGYTWIRVSVAGELGYLAIDFVSPA
ncbi:MAG: SH3 domain-containing protein [Chloroflexota bacterium]|nr:SH3 domain-containing protein [Chloroflexota bacterium]